MKYAVQTVACCALALGACRTEPSRPPETGEATASPSTPASANNLAPSPTPEAVSPPASEAAAKNPEPSPTKTVVTFDTDPITAPPKGFAFGLTGKGAPGKWVVQAEQGAPSGANVLAQLDSDSTNFRFPVAVLAEPQLENVAVSVRCKLISGRVDQACGLVARYRDQNNYFVTRANALEDNIRLYTVKDGKRTEIASRDIDVSPNVWHDYRLQVRGDHLQVFWNGERVLDHHDRTFAGVGAVGVWTKADSVTYFDDLRVEASE